MPRGQFRQEFQAAQPRWSRCLFWFVGIPAWISFAAAILCDMYAQGLPIWGWIALSVFGLVGCVQWYCYGNR